MTKPRKPKRNPMVEIERDTWIDARRVSYVSAGRDLLGNPQLVIRLGAKFIFFETSNGYKLVAPRKH